MKDHFDESRGFTDVTSFHPVTGEVLETSRVSVKSRQDVLESISSNGDKRNPNNFDYVARMYEYPRGTIVTRNSSSRVIEERVGVHGALYGFSLGGITDLETDLYNRALSQLNERARGSMDLAVSVLEYREVLRMLKGAGSIRSYLGNTIRAATRRGRKPSGETTVKSLVRDAGGNWLQWKLGLSPLLADFQSAVKEVSTGVTLRLMRIHARARDPIIASGLLEEPWASMSSVKVEGQQGVAFHIQYRPADGFNALRWASLNPVSWAWELMPLSFVIDWFVNVGQFVRDSETALAYNHTFDSGYVTYLFAYGGGIYSRGTLVSNDQSSKIDVVGSMSYKRFRRRVLGSWPFPRAPSFHSNLGGGQLLTSAALLSQLLKK